MKDIIESTHIALCKAGMFNFYTLRRRLRERYHVDIDKEALLNRLRRKS